MLILRPDPQESSAFLLMEGEAVADFIAAKKQGRRSHAEWGLVWSLGLPRGIGSDLSAAWRAASKNWERWKEWILGSSKMEAPLEDLRLSGEASDLQYRGERVGSIIVKSTGVTWVLGDPIIGMTGDATSSAAAQIDATIAWREFWSSATKPNEDEDVGETGCR